MKHIYLLVFLVIYSMASFGQYFTVDTTKGESPYNQTVSFIFPNVKSVGDLLAAININNTLIKDVLLLEPGTQKRSIFENVWGTKPMDIASVGDISFHVINDDPDFFCISISATSCSTACESWTRYYTFKSAGGKQVSLGELYTKEGIQALSDSVNVLKVKRIQGYIDTLKFAIDNKILSDADIKDYKAAIGLYEKSMQAQDQPSTFSLDKQRLTLYIGRCLPSKLFFLDQIDHSFSFDLSAYRHYLTDYGKSLFRQ